MSKILIIRSSRLLCEKLLRRYESESIANEIFVLSSVAVDKKQNGVTYLTTKSQNGFILKDLFSLKKQLQNYVFDEVYVLYNNETGFGYLNVDLYGFAVKAKNRIAINYSFDEFTLSFSYLFKKLFNILLGLVWFVLNSFLLIITMVFIGIGMVLVECFHLLSYLKIERDK